MEVKSVYMDLVEGKKKGNVWKLESEAFKKPIELKIGFETTELNSFTTTCESLDAKIAKQEEKFIKLQEKDADLQNGIRITQEQVTRNTENLSGCMHIIEEMDSELKELYKAIADAKSVIELQSGTILKLQEQVKELEKKVTKQPMVFHDKGFISGRERSGLGMINLQDGDYLMIMKTEVGEHNEYVTNKDELFMDKIHVEGQHYVPFYKLEGGTELDTPTATIYYDLILLPI